VIELAEIFRRYGPAYREKFGAHLLASHRRAMQAIEQCRTAALGGHVYYCPRCEQTQYRYHSCKNRHCPKCQQDAAQEWLAQQQQCLLRVAYFLLTFTLPADLRSVARSHQKDVYGLLFRAGAAATQRLARDPRLLGGHIGLIGVLHTWARDLSYHPHVHYLVPGGALSCDGQTWLPARGGFFLPVRPLGMLFRAKFRDGLRKTSWFERVPAKVWRQDWVVHCQSVGNGLPGLKYLARYVLRVALSNQRIQRVVNDQVTFSYQDADSGETWLCTLAAEEFIRRFLQHILPKGWVKVRYYGFFSPGQRQRLDQLRQRLGGFQAPECLQPFEPLETRDPAAVDGPMPAQPPARWPICGETLQGVQRLRPGGRSPPRS
jgi:ribosomal protein L37AE/L43A